MACNRAIGDSELTLFKWTRTELPFSFFASMTIFHHYSLPLVLPPFHFGGWCAFGIQFLQPGPLLSCIRAQAFLECSSKGEESTFSKTGTAMQMRIAKTIETAQINYLFARLSLKSRQNLVKARCLLPIAIEVILLQNRLEDWYLRQIRHGEKVLHVMALLKYEFWLE